MRMHVWGVALLALFLATCSSPSDFTVAAFLEPVGTVEGTFATPRECLFCSPADLNYHTVVYRFDETWSIEINRLGYLGAIGDTLYGPRHPTAVADSIESELDYLP